MYNHRYLILFRAVCLINPGHGMLFVPGVGMLDSEWNWCESIIEMVKLSQNDRESFALYGGQLITYIRYKHLKRSLKDQSD